jgi:hypothetical protein
MLDATVSRANDQYLNAFFVDGIPVWHFCRTPASGVPCTCTYSQDTAPDEANGEHAEDIGVFDTRAPARGRLQSKTLLRTPPDSRAILPPKEFEPTEGDEGLDWVDRVIVPEGLGTDYDAALRDLKQINETGVFHLARGILAGSFHCCCHELSRSAHHCCAGVKRQARSH